VVGVPTIRRRAVAATEYDAAATEYDAAATEYDAAATEGRRHRLVTKLATEVTGTLDFPGDQFNSGSGLSIM
jgi:hypothetical protein